MSRRSKVKISTEYDEPLSVANPFAGIDMGHVPESIPGFEKEPAKKEETKLRGRVDVIREKAGRAGKTVTVLRGFSETISAKELNAVALRLKKNCACGGSLKDNCVIELQGDICEKVMRELEKLGFRPVRCGG